MLCDGCHEHPLSADEETEARSVTVMLAMEAHLACCPGFLYGRQAMDGFYIFKWLRKKKKKLKDT